MIVKKFFMERRNLEKSKSQTKQALFLSHSEILISTSFSLFLDFKTFQCCLFQKIFSVFFLLSDIFVIGLKLSLSLYKVD